MRTRHDTLQDLALIREILFSSLDAGVALTTKAGEAVTLESLPALHAAGTEIRLIDNYGRLALVTAVDDDPAGMEARPAFVQIGSDGMLVKSFLLRKDMMAFAINEYEPETLRLSDDFYDVSRDDSGNLLRLRPANAADYFKDRLIRA